MFRKLWCITGLPLSGKSTVGKVLADLLGDATYIATGDIARKLANTPELDREMATKDLFSDETKLRYELLSAINAANTQHVVVDGFPRFGDQVIYLNTVLNDMFPHVLYVTTGDDSILLQRAKNRARDPRDMDNTKILHRYNQASKNLGEVEQVCRQQLLPMYTIINNDSVEFIIKQLKKFLKGKVQ